MKSNENEHAIMNPFDEHRMLLTRRHFFGKAATGIGVAALGALMQKEAFGSYSNPDIGLPGNLPHAPPKAKRVIYLFQSGAPSPQDLFDYKPKLQEHFGKDLRDFVEFNQRVTGMTAGQKSFPIAGTRYSFAKHGKSGAEISELLPHISGIADDLCIVRSMHTEAINHDPAVTFFQTGSQISGRPSIGSWLSYGLGSLNDDLPSFITMVSRGTPW